MTSGRLWIDEMIERGVYGPIGQVGGTGFGRKPPGADASRIDLDECRRIVEATCAELHVNVVGPSKDPAPAAH